MAVLKITKQKAKKKCAIKQKFKFENHKKLFRSNSIWKWNESSKKSYIDVYNPRKDHKEFI